MAIWMGSSEWSALRCVEISRSKSNFHQIRRRILFPVEMDREAGVNVSAEFGFSRWVPVSEF